ncbi:hypothetical protein V8E55_001235 [Tylopilus felleus]
MEGSIIRANPNTIQDKVLVGYQGWFTCAGDGPPLDPAHHGWLHWFNSPIPSGGRPNVDLWPDISEYDPSELYPAPGLISASGDPVHLFSSRHPKTVQRHFHWMALHGVDGAFLQRFAGQTELKQGNLAIRDLRDEIGDRVREAAEAEGRVFAIMYDVSGVSPDKIQNILEQDWTHLLRDKNILDSPSYLRDQDRPVVALWGFGLNGRNHTPELVRAITGFFRSFTPGGVYLVAGTPGHWRTSTSDADRNPEFVKVWTECFDAISPWTVGRFGNEEEADRWGQGRLKADAEYLRNLEAEGGRKVDYIPVVLPGGSGFNLSEGKWRMNDMRRNGGRFLWRQLYNAQCAGVRTIYGAMWDEYDEGTVFMPVVSHASQLPVHPSFRFLALDVDGLDLPSDWYMRIAGLAAEAFHGERTLGDTLPVDELKDYWSTRPHYEATKNVETVETLETVETAQTVESTQTVETVQTVDRVEDKRVEEKADVDAVTRSLKKWEISQENVDIPTDAPPPYSLEEMSPQPSMQADPSGAGPSVPPPIRRATRPDASLSASLVAGGAMAAVAATAAAFTMSPGSMSPPPSSVMPRPSPPPVNMSSRPAPPPPMRPPYQAPQSPPLPGSPPGPPVGYASMYSPTTSPPPMDPRGRGRSRSRSHSRSRSRSPSRRHKHKDRRSRSRSRSRSSSRGGRSQSQVYPSPHGHGHTQSLGHAQSVGPGAVYGHGHGPGYGHGHGPGPGYGLGHSHSYSPGSYDGYQHYAPLHSHPVGHGPSGSVSGYPEQGQPGYGQGPPQGGYTAQYPSPSGGPGPQGGYGYGQGHGPGQGQQGYGYTPHPSSGYQSPGSGAGNPASGSGGGGGGLQGGLATALQAVEGIAGKQRRQQLEKTVGTLLNKLR